MVNNVLTVNLMQVVYSLSTFFSEHNVKGLNFEYSVQGVCFAIFCLNIGTKVASNKHIILLFVIQGDLSKTCNMHGCQEERA